MNQVRVEFQDQGRSVMAWPGQTVLEVCWDHNIPMESMCGGFAGCNSCRICIHSGELSPLDEVEIPFLDRPDQRLGCQARIVGPTSLSLDPGE